MVWENCNMEFDKIKSYAKINLALNITGKTSSLHKIDLFTCTITGTKCVSPYFQY